MNIQYAIIVNEDGSKIVINRGFRYGPTHIKFVNPRNIALGAFEMDPKVAVTAELLSGLEESVDYGEDS